MLGKSIFLWLSLFRHEVKMTKIISFLLVAIVILAIVSSPVYAVVNKISPGDKVFLGESGLDLTGFIDGPVMIAWYHDPCNYGIIGGYRGCVPPEDETPTIIKKIEDPADFFVKPIDFVWFPGEWYLWDGEKHGDVVFIIEEPSISINIWDSTKQRDITNKAIPQGNYVDFLIETNMDSVTKREGYNEEDAPFSIFIKLGKDGDIISELPGKDNAMISLLQLPVDKNKWYWVGLDEDHTKAAKGDGWNTGDLSVLPGEYWVWAESNLNGMIDNYLAPDGSTWTSKTQSSVKKIKITEEPGTVSKPTHTVGKPIYGGQTD